MVGTKLHGVVTVLLGNTRGNHDHRQVLQTLGSTDAAQQIKTVHARHFNIGQHHAGQFFALQLVQRLQAIVGGDDAVAFALQQALRHTAHGDGVVHHHDQRHLARWLHAGDGLGRRCFALQLLGGLLVQHGGQALAQFTDLRTVHRGQRHRVVDQHHSTRGQHRHASQARQARHLRAQRLDHHFLLAQHFIHVQCNALRGASDQHHRPCLACAIVHTAG